MTDSREVALALATAWHEEMSPYLQLNCCVLASRIGIETLHYFGINAHEVPCDAIAFNARAIEQMEAGIPLADWPDDAWSVGACANAPGEGYPGHLIIYTDSEMIDLTVTQFDRPEHKMDIRIPLVLDDSQLTDAKNGWRTWAGNTITIMYRATLDRSYKQTPDWREGKKEAGIVIRRVRELLGA